MPEYLAPGVYVEETSFRSKSIEGVSTTTTGFVGPTRYGPIGLENDVLTSLGDYERTYGDRQQIRFGSTVMHNYLWHAVRAFFEEGGKRLYVSRVFRQTNNAAYTPPSDPDVDLHADGSVYNDGHGRIGIGAGVDPDFRIRARFSGAAGNFRVTLTAQMGQNVLSQSGGQVKAAGLSDRDVVWVANPSSTPTPPVTGALYRASFNQATQVWTLYPAVTSPPGSSILLSALTDSFDELRIVTLTVTVTAADGSSSAAWGGLAPDPLHQRDGAPDSLTAFFSAEPSSLLLARTLPIVIKAKSTVDDGLEMLTAIFGSSLSALTCAVTEYSVTTALGGGNDGVRPDAGAYQGSVSADSKLKTGLVQFEDIDDISIVAAPGSTFDYGGSYGDDANAIIGHLISHATRMRYRIAVLDCGNGQSIAEVRKMRARLDSSYAALYYPWVRVLDPVTRAQINLPPSGFVTGIYARNDVNRGVYKAPANEVVNLASGFETLLNRGQQEVLNPEGVNCLRYFAGRGFRVWGARTVSSDPEWKYVNLRRYFAYLEHSLDKGTQWAVFEPNGQALWANVRRTIEDFLLNEWQSGALLGDKPEKAYFVRCDRSTMTQNDLDNGRMVCLIGVAALRPAEFVIFRIGQWTSDRKA